MRQFVVSFVSLMIVGGVALGIPMILYTVLGDLGIAIGVIICWFVMLFLLCKKILPPEVPSAPEKQVQIPKDTSERRAVRYRELAKEMADLEEEEEREQPTTHRTLPPRARFTQPR